MESSKGFVDLEELIETNRGVFSISDVDQLLRQLEEDKHITAAEHTALLMKISTT